MKLHKGLLSILLLCSIIMSSLTVIASTEEAELQTRFDARLSKFVDERDILINSTDKMIFDESCKEYGCETRGWCCRYFTHTYKPWAWWIPWYSVHATMTNNTIYDYLSVRGRLIHPNGYTITTKYEGQSYTDYVGVRVDSIDDLRPSHAVGNHRWVNGDLDWSAQTNTIF